MADLDLQSPEIQKEAEMAATCGLFVRNILRFRLRGMLLNCWAWPGLIALLLHKDGPVIRQEMIGEEAKDVPVEEPWMRLSTVCPAPAGTAIFRDNRAWHSGTP